jgi:hypothetical protein
MHNIPQKLCQKGFQIELSEIGKMSVVPSSRSLHPYVFYAK